MEEDHFDQFLADAEHAVQQASESHKADNFDQFLLSAEQALSDQQPPSQDLNARLLAQAHKQFDDKPDPRGETGGPLGGLIDATRNPQALDAGLGGMAKSVFEMKDFVFGDTPDASKSAVRQDIEHRTKELSEASMLNGFAAGIGQFAGGMIGVGKLGEAAKMLPWVGQGMKAVGEALPMTTEAVKAALAGATAFDPQDERMSNWVQDTPLANPVTAWLAASPDDSNAEGRLKAAIESLGMDAVLGSTLLLAGKAYKRFRAGDIKGGQDAINELQAQQKAHLDQEAADDAAGASQGPDQVSGGPDAGPQDNLGAPAGDRVLPDQPEVPVTGNPADELGGNSAKDAGGGGEVQQMVADGEVQPEVVANPTAAAEDAGVNLRVQNPRPSIKLSDEDTTGLLDLINKDMEAMENHGGWYQAVDTGHVFGKGEGVNYAKLNTDGEVDELRARLIDTVEEQIDKAKGGKVLSDLELDRRVQRLVKVTGEDPAAMMGWLKQQGDQINHAAAAMEVGYGLSNKFLQDAWALAAKYRIGDYTVGGSREATLQEIKKRLALGASAYTNARSITANSGRALRRMRSEFALDPAMFSKIDGDQMVDILLSSEANPRSLKYLASPSIWQQIGDFAMYLRINSLVSGPKTQLINLMTTGYMVGVRPMERILGEPFRVAMVKAFPRLAPTGIERPSQQLIKENIRQYVYMGTALQDGWSMALKAFVKNDSVLSPHNSELYGKGMAMGENPHALSRYKPWDSVPNIIYNALSVAAVPVGLPTRLLGSTDELAKQIVYRSKVMARAHMEANLALAGKNLPEADAKQFVKEYIETKLSRAFDEKGRGTDSEALREAQIATFQQDLLPKTFGKGVQDLTNNVQAVRLVLPFVKTPTNVIRYGWNMTPVLNIFQKEYRNMLLGRLGQEMQAQAIGQMTMGTLFMGAAAYMASNGLITGGGPSDPKTKQELMATGWRPYSVPITHEDGTKTYVEYGRGDPVAIPFGIIADLQDAIHALGEDDDENEGVAEGIMSLGIALAKQFTNKSYLLGVNQMMEALQDPDRRGGSVAGNIAASFVPYSAASRQLSQDDYLREARSVADRIMQAVPGMSSSIPARYNWLGEPVLNRQGLWTDDNGSLVDHEVQRLALEHGSTLTRVGPNLHGVDLRDITMANGKNAYEEYQRLSGKPTNRSIPLRTIAAKIIQSDAYKRAPDGDSDVKGTKLWILHGRVAKYREAADKVLRRDPNVRAAFMKADQKVKDHFMAIRSEQPPTASDLSSIGDAFGVELGN